MLVLRLQRTGRKNLASYRIVVAEKSRAVKGKFLEVLGHYLPAQEHPVFECDAARAEHWVKQGATPSDTLARLLKKNGVKGMDSFIHRYPKRKSKKEVPEAQTAAPQAEPAPAGDKA